jgi:thiol-disulfide isomerase/thioredoxin
MQQAGATLSKAGLAGRGVMLHFWASWCNACKRGMPSIQALHQRFSGPQFQVMGVTDDNKKAAQHYLKTQGFSFPVAWDHGNRLGAHFKVRGIPFTVFLDGRGKVVGDLTGIVSEADGIERIEAILTREDEPTGPKVKVE